MDVVYEVLCMYLLGANAKLIKTNTGFFMSFRPVRTNRFQKFGRSSLWVFVQFSNVNIKNST